MERDLGKLAHITTLKDTAENGTPLHRTYVLNPTASTRMELQRSSGPFGLSEPVDLGENGTLRDSVSVEYDSYTSRAVGITADRVFLADPQLRTALDIPMDRDPPFQQLCAITSDGRGVLYVADNSGVWQLQLPHEWQDPKRASYQQLLQEQQLELIPAHLYQLSLKTRRGGQLKPPAWLRWEEGLGLILGYEKAILCVRYADLIFCKPSSMVPYVLYGDSGVADGQEEDAHGSQEGDSRSAGSQQEGSGSVGDSVGSQEEGSASAEDSAGSQEEGSGSSGDSVGSPEEGSCFSSMVVDSLGTVIVSQVMGPSCTMLLRGELAYDRCSIRCAMQVHCIQQSVQQLALLPSGFLAAVHRDGIDLVDMGLAPSSGHARADPCDRLFYGLAGQLLHDQPVSPYDVTLVVEGIEYGAHRAILAARSPYFRSLLDPHVCFANADTDKIHLPPADPTAVQLVVWLLYTNRVELTMLNTLPQVAPAHMVLASAMELADHLQVPYMVDQLMAPLMDMVTPDNVVDLLLWADERAGTMGGLLGRLVEWYRARFEGLMASVGGSVGKGDRPANNAAAEWRRLWTANKKLAQRVTRNWDLEEELGRVVRREVRQGCGSGRWWAGSGHCALPLLLHLCPHLLHLLQTSTRT